MEITSEIARKEMPRCGLRPSCMCKRYGLFRFLNRRDGTITKRQEYNLLYSTAAIATI